MYKRYSRIIICIRGNLIVSYPPLTISERASHVLESNRHVYRLRDWCCTFSADLIYPKRALVPSSYTHTHTHKPHIYTRTKMHAHTRTPKVFWRLCSFPAHCQALSSPHVRFIGSCAPAIFDRIVWSARHRFRCKTRVGGLYAGSARKNCCPRGESQMSRITDDRRGGRVGGWEEGEKKSATSFSFFGRRPIISADRFSKGSMSSWSTWS